MNNHNSFQNNNDNKINKTNMVSQSHQGTKFKNIIQKQSQRVVSTDRYSIFHQKIMTEKNIDSNVYKD